MSSLALSRSLHSSRHLVVTYLPSLSVAASHFRSFCSEHDRPGGGGSRPQSDSSAASTASSEGGRVSKGRMAASSMSWMGSTDDEAQEDAQKTLGGLGQMALFRGATEHKLDMHDHQLKVLMRFRNTMVQVILVDFFIGLINIYIICILPSNSNLRSHHDHAQTSNYFIGTSYNSKHFQAS